MRVIVAAAGTAGHINPGLAIANKIMEEEKGSEVLFIGTPRGLENDLVPRAGYKLKTMEDDSNSKKNSLLIKQKNFKVSMTIEKGDIKNVLKAFQNKNKKKNYYNSITVSDIFFTGVNKLNSFKYSSTLKRDSSVV